MKETKAETEGMTGTGDRGHGEDRRKERDRGHGRDRRKDRDRAQGRDKGKTGTGAKAGQRKWK